MFVIVNARKKKEIIHLFILQNPYDLMSLA